LIVDYPPEECQGFAAQLKNLGLDLIFLLTPTSSQARIQQVAQLASGYVYYVSLKGVTGSFAIDTDAVAAMLPRLRAYIQIPIGVGFGIRDAATARRVAQVADAVVIGSKLIELMDCQAPAQAIAWVQAFLRDVRQALDTSFPSTKEPSP
jgi:tryptophan synthase alpha chain